MGKVNNGEKHISNKGNKEEKVCNYRNKVVSNQRKEVSDKEKRQKVYKSISNIGRAGKIREHCLKKG